MGAMTPCTFPFFKRQMLIFAALDFRLHAFMTSITELQHWFNGVSSIFACVGIMAGPAGLFLEWWMDGFFFYLKEHIAMALHAELV